MYAKGIGFVNGTLWPSQFNPFTGIDKLVDGVYGGYERGAWASPALRNYLQVRR